MGIREERQVTFNRNIIGSDVTGTPELTFVDSRCQCLCSFRNRLLEKRREQTRKPRWHPSVVLCLRAQIGIYLPTKDCAQRVGNGFPAGIVFDAQIVLLTIFYVPIDCFSASLSHSWEDGLGAFECSSYILARTCNIGPSLQLRYWSPWKEHEQTNPKEMCQKMHYDEKTRDTCKREWISCDLFILAFSLACVLYGLCCFGPNYIEVFALHSDWFRIIAQKRGKSLKVK